MLPLFVVYMLACFFSEIPIPVLGPFVLFFFLLVVTLLTLIFKVSLHSKDMSPLSYSPKYFSQFYDCFLIL